MKRKGRHPDRVLTAVKVKALKRPGRYADGNGLYLIVEPSGAKRWMLRIMAQGRRLYTFGRSHIWFETGDGRILVCSPRAPIEYGCPIIGCCPN